jgi:hypothetical protein
MVPAEKLAQIQKRIEFIVEEWSAPSPITDSRKRASIRTKNGKSARICARLCEQFNLEEPPPRVPPLCIEIIRDEHFSGVQKRCDDHIAEGVTQVWLLDPDFKRAYTVTKTEGLREFKGGILQIAEPRWKWI